MSDQLDLLAALEARDDGIAQVANHNAPWIEVARVTARRIAAEKGEVIADDVREVLYAQDLRPDHYNAWGAVFGKGSGLRFTGRFQKSRVVQGHGNLQRVWELDR